MEKIVKNFRDWFFVKEKIHNIQSKPPFFKEGEIWWCSLGENVGVEINGKSRLFTRPVVIFKKLSKESFIGLPTTSQIKNGSWYITIRNNEKDSCVLLNQMRSFSYKRLSTRISMLDESDFQKIKSGFLSLMN